MNEIDYEKLREDLIDYYGTASYNGFPMAIIELSNVENASYEELINIAIKNNFNLNNYKKEEIRGLLIEALKKYTYFSEEKNIELNLEPVTELFEKRDDIYKKRKQTALNEITEKDIKDINISLLSMLILLMRNKINPSAIIAFITYFIHFPS